MEKTITRGGVSITLHLNENGTVDLQKMMQVRYFDLDENQIVKEMYPDTVEGGNYGTIDAQLDLVKASINFDEAYAAAVIKSFKKFFDERPSLAPSAVSKEAGFSPRYLPLILEGKRRPTENAVEKLRPVMEKYGYNN